MIEYILRCLIVCASSLPYLIFVQFLICIYYKKKGIHVTKQFLIGWLLLACLLLSIFTVTGLPGFHDLKDHIPLDVITTKTNLTKININIFNSMEQLLNILIFIPVGFLIPLLWKAGTALISTLFIGFLLSLIIEITQLFSWRTTDINDLILNILGTLIGYCIYFLLFRKTKFIQIDNSKNGFLTRHSAVLSILFLFLSYFLILKPVISLLIS